MRFSIPCDFDTLVRAAAGGELSQEFRAHVDRCKPCSDELASQRAITEALRADTIWTEPEEPRPPAVRLGGVLSFAKMLRREDDEAEIICDEVLSGPEAWWSTRFTKLGVEPTAGVVRQLLERMRQLLEKSPAGALQVTALAVETARQLTTPPYSRTTVVNLLGQALRDHAFVLGFMGRVSQALTVAEEAEQTFLSAPLAEYELARLDLVKANLLRWLERFPEAVKLAARAADTFEEFGDNARRVDARITEGAILFDAGETETALWKWRSVIGAPEIDGQVAHVRLVHNIGLAHRELGDLALAETFFESAMAGFESLGLQTESIRSGWALATTLTAEGRYGESIAILRGTLREFEKLHLEGDAALVALELAETLLLTGDAAEVPALCKMVQNRYGSEALPERGSSAMALLEETLNTSVFTPSAMRRVRELLHPVLPRFRRTAGRAV